MSQPPGPAHCRLCRETDLSAVVRFDDVSLASRSRKTWMIVRCHRCGLVQVDPAEVDPRPATVYADDEYGFARSRLADELIDGRSHAARVLDELAPFLADGRLLDVGCGTGDFLIESRGRGWDVSGVEMSPDAVRVARGRGLAVTVGTLRDAQLPDAAFDCVVLLDVIEHLTDPLAEMREIRRVLRPGGIVVVETPNWRSLYRRLLRHRWAALQPRIHLLYFDESTLRRALVEACFEPLSASTEIVSLLSPEAARRGLGPRLALGMARDLIVRWRLRRPPSRLDRWLLEIGPAHRIDRAAGSYRAAAEATTLQPGEPSETTDTSRPSWLTRLLRRVNGPVDRAVVRRGMGEQLRMLGRAR
jgi:SAM-dependent methyltransferase